MNAAENKTSGILWKICSNGREHRTGCWNQKELCGNQQKLIFGNGERNTTRRRRRRRKHCLFVEEIKHFNNMGVAT